VHLSWVHARHATFVAIESRENIVTADTENDKSDEDRRAVYVRGSVGTQVGDHNVQFNIFAPSDPSWPGHVDSPLTPPSGAADSLVQGHAFISYVREDSGEVDMLQRALEAAGVPVWRDTANLWPGEDWRAKIRGAITHDALVFIACFSSHSAARRTSYQNEELLLAIDQMRLRRPGEPWLIPVRFDDCDIPDLELGAGRTLDSFHRADIFGPHRDQAIRRLVAAVQRLLQQSGSPTTTPIGSPWAASSADILARIELERRQAELTPLFRLRCEPWGTGHDADLRLRLQLNGPTMLGRLDGVTVTIRDDHFRRGESPHIVGGPTREQVKQQVWGPYRFRPGTGPDRARADDTGRVTVYAAELPVGEELPYFLERTRPPLWAVAMTQANWNEQRGPVIRLLIEPWRDTWKWTLPCEIDLSADHDLHYAGWVVDVRP
jgi:TIR domain